MQSVLDASSLLPSAAAPRQTVSSVLTWALSLQAVGDLAHMLRWANRPPGHVTAGSTGLVKKGTAALWMLLRLSAVLSSDLCRAYKFEDLEE